MPFFFSSFSIRTTISPSCPASGWSSFSTRVIPSPSVAKMKAYSQPMNPAPMMTIDRGSSASWTRSSVVSSVFPSVGRPGISAGREPAARTMAFASTSVRPPSGAVTARRRGPRKAAVPRIIWTLRERRFRLMVPTSQRVSRLRLAWISLKSSSSRPSTRMPKFLAFFIVSNMPVAME